MPPCHIRSLIDVIIILLCLDILSCGIGAYTTSPISSYVVKLHLASEHDRIVEDGRARFIVLLDYYEFTVITFGFFFHLDRGDMCWWFFKAIVTTAWGVEDSQAEASQVCLLDCHSRSIEELVHKWELSCYFTSILSGFEPCYSSRLHLLIWKERAVCLATLKLG